MNVAVEKEIPKGSLFDKLLGVIETFSQILNLPCQTPLGPVSPDVVGGANRWPRQDDSSTKTILSVLYFFTIFVMFVEAV